jgi:hypothetical protein
VLVVSYGLFVVAQAASWFPGGAGFVQALGPQPLAALLLLLGVLASWGRRAHERMPVSCRVAPHTQSA